jgi:hypothetical protein
MNKKRLVKSVFVLSIILCVGSLGMAYGCRCEPYPALLFPGGAGTVTTTGPLKYPLAKLTAITDQGQRHDISVHDLLNTVPRHLRLSILKRNFGLPTLGKGSEVASPAVSEGRAWLLRQLHRLTGQEDVAMLEHTAYHIVLPSRWGQRPTEAQVLSITTIPLR